MPAELWALTTAFCFASGHVAAKFGTRTGMLLPGLVVSLATGTTAVAVVALLTIGSWSISWWPAMLFVGSGLLGPGLGRALSMRGIRDAGASVASPLMSSANPVLASMAGLLVFGEDVRASRILALMLIVTGIWLVGRGGSANLPGTAGPMAPATTSRLVLLWPVGAGATFAASDVLREAALSELPEPLLGALLALAASFAVYTTFLLANGSRRRSFRLNTAAAWFGLHGLFSAAAIVSLLFALRAGELSVVSPIVASQPVVVLLLSALLLRRLERLRIGTILGAVVVFAGVTVMSSS